MLPIKALFFLLAAIGCVALIQVDIERKSLVDPLAHDKLRLAERWVAQSLDNQDTLYFANVSLGGAQPLRVHVDTGSSDLWVNYAKSSLCNSLFRRCDDSGVYDPAVSPTYQYVNSKFFINYVDRTGAAGDYVKDTITIGGVAVPQFQFGVGLRSTSAESVLGIGYAGNEASARRFNEAYSNLPLRLIELGLMKSNAYSLWLNDLDASTGQLLLGGVNTAKYHGPLSIVPIIKNMALEDIREFTIALTGISHQGIGLAVGPENYPTPALLDSGTSYTYLPPTIGGVIYQLLNATVSPNGGRLAFVSCALAALDQTLDFDFSGVKISVPFNELVFPAQLRGLIPPIGPDGAPLCMLGILTVSSGPAVLGDTFLRSAYVVYDMSNNEIALAQTNFNSTTDNIVEIGAGRDSIPNAIRVEGAVKETEREMGPMKAFDAPEGGAGAKIMLTQSSPAPGIKVQVCSLGWLAGMAFAVALLI